jgi:hypothetical protein
MKKELPLNHKIGLVIVAQVATVAMAFTDQFINPFGAGIVRALIVFGAIYCGVAAGKKARIR